MFPMINIMCLMESKTNTLMMQMVYAQFVDMFVSIQNMIMIPMFLQNLGNSLGIQNIMRYGTGICIHVYTVKQNYRM